MIEHRKTILRINTPIEGDGVSLHGLCGREEIGRYFRYRLELHAPRDKAVPIEELLARSVSVSIENEGQSPRRIHGIIVEVRRVGNTHRYEVFEALLLPPHALLGSTTQVGFRVHQERDLSQILDAELDGFSYRLDMHEPDHPRCLSVRYAESPSNYILRLLEEDGRYSFFESDDKETTLVVADSSPRASIAPGCESLPFGTDWDKPSVTAWDYEQSVVPRRVDLVDYHDQSFTGIVNASATHPAPGDDGPFGSSYAGSAMKDCVVARQANVAHRFSKHDRYGEVHEEGLEALGDELQRHANVQVQQLGAASLTYRGKTDSSAIRPGYLMRLSDANDHSGEYFVTRLEQRVRLPLPDDSGKKSKPYRATFHAIPKRVPYRMPRRRARPSIKGVISATVVGHGDETPTTDEGHVKVAFRFDPRAEPSSCWVRVSQSLAGNHHGSARWPQAGEEVLLGFRGGDPDQPRIVGCLYNAAHKPAIDSSTMRHTEGSWFRTKGGSREQMSRLTFKRSTTAEAIVHSEAETHTSAKNGFLLTTGRDLNERIGFPSLATAADDEQGGSGSGGDSDSSSSGDNTQDVHGDGSESTGGDYSFTVDGSYNHDNADVSTWMFGGTQKFVTPDLTMTGIMSNMVHGQSTRVHAGIGKTELILGSSDFEILASVWGVMKTNAGYTFSNDGNTPVNTTWGAWVQKHGFGVKTEKVEVEQAGTTAKDRLVTTKAAILENEAVPVTVEESANFQS
ncbi:Phage-related baseplate assembly protein [Planctomycetes bacterium Pan216]|uniref:Phage-related baseplate assembly protein n=1 Tax=Kolteria novifilia TaxID=2527975 RepID=A0A518B124_9BACT|nr:Phage-related baseplate assembly protein [Planctomycetes bacterium Pan216]